MKKVSLSGSLRENVGKKDAKAERKKGRVPCVIYGGKEQVHFSLDAIEFKPVLHTPETYLIEINIDGKPHQVILQDVQFHPVTDSILHADFLEVTNDKPITVALPVKLKGTSPGVVQGGRLQLKIRKLRLKGLLADIPEFIELDISKLDISDSIKVRDIERENLSFIDPASSVVVMVKTARGLTAEELAEEEAEEAEAAEAAEGESSGEKAEDSEESKE